MTHPPIITQPGKYRARNGFCVLITSQDGQPTDFHQWKGTYNGQSTYWYSSCGYLFSSRKQDVHDIVGLWDTEPKKPVNAERVIDYVAGFLAGHLATPTEEIKHLLIIALKNARDAVL